MKNSFQHTLLLSASILATSSIFNCSIAFADCIASPSPNFVCSGTVFDQQTFTLADTKVLTEADFNLMALDAVLVDGIKVSASGDLSFTDVHVNGDRSYINAPNTTGTAIDFSSAGVDPTSITIDTNGTIIGGADAIKVTSSNTGTISVTTGESSITGKNKNGIIIDAGLRTLGTVVKTGDGKVEGYITGIEAYQGREGSINITTGAGTVTGINKMGISASTYGIDNVIVTGSGDIFGGLYGITASNSGSGILSITTGSGKVTGTRGAGIASKGVGNIHSQTITTGAGDVFGSIDGIFANNTGVGDLVIKTGGGDVNGASDSGIKAFGASTSSALNITTGEGHVTGGFNGIYAGHLGSRDLMVISGGEVTGSSYGIVARNGGGGSLRLETRDGDVSGTTGFGIFAGGYLSGNAVSIATGKGAIHGSKYGIYGKNKGKGGVDILTGDGDVIGNTGIGASNDGAGGLTVRTNTGDVIGISDHGISAKLVSGTDLRITTGTGAVAGKNDGISASHAGTGAFSIAVGGVVSNIARDAAGVAISTTGNGVSLSNLASGNLIGRIVTADKDDVVNNAGVWLSGGTSNFGGGHNQVNNAGIVRTANSANTSELTTFDNLGVFANQGTGLLTLADDAAGGGSTMHDKLAINGDFAGGSTLELDAFLGGPGSTSDQLLVRDNISGVTAVRINNTNAGLGTSNADGITLVTHGGNAQDDAFYLENGPIQSGLFAYDLVHDTALKQFKLVGEASADAGELATLVSAGQSLWYDTSGAGIEHSEKRRNDESAAAIIGKTRVQPVSYTSSSYPAPWAKVMGRTADRTTSTGYRYNLDTTGMLAGVDADVQGMPGASNLTLGATAGYIDANQHFKSGSKADYEGFTGGIYASYVNEGFHMNGEIRGTLLDLDYTLAGSPSSRSNVTNIGGTIDTSYRFAVDDGLYAEPLAQVAYVSSTVRDGKILGVAFAGDGESLRSATGLRLGGSIPASSDFTLEPSLTAKYWHEFEGNNAATFSTFQVFDKTPQSFGEIAVNIAATSVTSGWSSALSADVQFAKDYSSIGGHFALKKSF